MTKEFIDAVINSVRNTVEANKTSTTEEGQSAYRISLFLLNNPVNMIKHVELMYKMLTEEKRITL